AQHPGALTRSAVAIWPPAALPAMAARSADAMVRSDTRRVDRPRRIVPASVSTAFGTIQRGAADLFDRSALDPLRDQLGVLALQARVQAGGDLDDGLVLIEGQLVEDLAALEVAGLALRAQERRDVGPEGDRLRLRRG